MRQIINFFLRRLTKTRQSNIMRERRFHNPRPPRSPLRLPLIFCIATLTCYGCWKLTASSSTEESAALERIAPLPTTIEYPQGALQQNVSFDLLVVEKKKRRLLAYSKGNLLRVYAIALGQKPEGQKKTAGDKRTPEGQYTISAKNDQSAYHKALAISYPDTGSNNSATGSDHLTSGRVYIHGLPKEYAFLGIAHRASDWTNGCIALSNEEIDELFEHTTVGTTITIQP